MESVRNERILSQCGNQFLIQKRAWRVRAQGGRNLVSGVDEILEQSACLFCTGRKRMGRVPDKGIVLIEWLDFGQ